jgi:membrane protein DedA with SNARE-associated domain
LVSHLLESIPPEAIYLIVGLLIMVESLGIPLPGEIALVTAAVLATQHKIAVAPEWIAVSGSLGAIAGDSIGFYVGHRVGKPLFDWLGRKFPRHFGPSHVAVAERFFTRHGAWAVFFGRFIALLRIFSGPLAGSLHMPYDRFLLANASGGIVWASGLTYLIWYLGQAAEKWLSRVSWIGLVAAVVIGVAITLLIRRRTSKLVREHEAESAAAAAASSSSSAAAEAASSPAEAEDAPAPAGAANASSSAGEEDGPAPAVGNEAPDPARGDEAPALVRGDAAPPPVGEVDDRTPPPTGNGEARLPAVNGQAEPPARQRTESDRQ